MKKKIFFIILAAILGIIIIIAGSMAILNKVEEKSFDLACGDLTPEEQMLTREKQKDWPTIGKIMWNYTVYSLHEEEKERLSRIEEGLPVMGRDTLIIWQDKYDITKTSTEKSLDIYENKERHTIFNDVKSYKVKGNKLYVVASKGYAVIDKENSCRIFIKKPEGYVPDEIFSEKMIYLKNFSDFDKKEIKQFKKIEK